LISAFNPKQVFNLASEGVGNMKTKLFDQIYRCDSYGYSIKASVSLIVDIILQIKLLAPCYSYYLYVNSGREISMSISSRTDCRIYRAVIQVVIMQFAVLSTNVYAKLTLLGTTEFCVPCADSSFNSIVTVTSPDGRYLVYPSRATNAALYSVVTFGGKNPVELTNINLRTVRGLNGENYKISPDSRRVYEMVLLEIFLLLRTPTTFLSAIIASL
jgi:hypothetical protein